MPSSPITAAGVPPQPAGTDQQHGLPDASDPPSPHDLRTADHVLVAAAQSCLLFSGPIQRPDGISAFLNGYGLDCDSIDNDRAYGRGDSHNILRDS
eukprot:6186263-Pleurochrysis_carterae.AAC.3